MKSIVWYQFGNPFKVKFRKHVCLFCGNDLSIRKQSKVVNSKSDEAQYYDFSVGETRIKGDVEFIHKLFFCENCKKDFEFVTQISFEDHQKKENKFCSKFCKNLGIGEMKKVWVDRYRRKKA